jgi:FkbM family methyltransferase
VALAEPKTAPEGKTCNAEDRRKAAGYILATSWAPKFRLEFAVERDLMKKRLVVAIRVAIVVIALVTAFVVSGPVRFHAIWMYLSGRSAVGFAESMEAGALSVSQVRAFDEVHGKTKPIQKEAGGNALFETPAGSYWMPSDSRDALEWDLAEQGRRIYGKDGNRGERRGDIVLDCGANVGVYTKTALASGAKLVVAIEPAPENVECLRRNLAQEIAAGKVIVYPKGVWDREDTLALSRDPKNSTRDSLLKLEGDAIDTIRVPLTTIDKLVAELKLDRVDFIKMDIEGAERNAVLGAKETLRRFKPRMALCVYHRPGDPVAIPRAVLDLAPGYHVYTQGLMLKGSIIAEVAHFW